MAIEFITTQEIKDRSGEVKGKIKIIKVKEEENAMVDFTCPKCGHQEKSEQPWCEPFVIGEKMNRQLFPKCNKCGHIEKVVKLKKAAKKEKTREKNRRKREAAKKKLE